MRTLFPDTTGKVGVNAAFRARLHSGGGKNLKIAGWGGWAIFSRHNKKWFPPTHLLEMKYGYIYTLYDTKGCSHPSAFIQTKNSNKRCIHQRQRVTRHQEQTDLPKEHVRCKITLKQKQGAFTQKVLCIHKTRIEFSK